MLRARDVMNLHNSIDLLVALNALLAEQSVTNGGRRIHLSQPAMSGALARLRHALHEDRRTPER